MPLKRRHKFPTFNDKWFHSVAIAAGEARKIRQQRVTINGAAQCLRIAKYLVNK